MLAPGTRLGPYEIVTLLGAGAMGEVYRGIDRRLDRPVAIKILCAAEAQCADRLERFQREARAISRLSHPHVCALYDVGEQEGLAFLVMEYLEGQTLAERLEEGPLPVGEALRCGMQIADALEAAHQHGIIHRDLKPGNIMLTAAGVKLLDFGVAKLRADEPGRTLVETLTKPGSVVGTVAYMAPEQLQGREVDARTDIFALGVVLCEMATGALPFQGSTEYELTAAILREPVPALPSSLPSAVRRVLERCLAKDPSQRYQHASEVSAALEMSQTLDAVAADQVCPGCSASVPAHATFCPGCGMRLTTVCTNCRASNPATHRFCLQCGKPLAPEPEGSTDHYVSPQSYTPHHLADRIVQSRSLLEGERKQITVLFGHVPNAATLAERLGHKEMQNRLSRLFQVALDEIHRYEGTVNQFVADGFMALFGAPVVHEDDARRAVLAALAILQRLDGAATPRSEDEVIVQMGVNTGPVVVGKIADNLRMEYTAVGETTKLASLLQQAAEPGTILISDATRRLVREEVQVAPVELNLPTKTGPVQAWRVLDVAPEGSRLDHRLARKLAPFVGRDRELQALRELFALIGNGEGQVASVVGEPGIGKTRLLYEFQRAVRDQGATFQEGRCLSYASAIPYVPLLDVVRGQCGILERDTADVVRNKAEAALQRLGIRFESAGPYLLHLLGGGDDTPLPASSPEAVKTRTFDVLRQMILKESEQQPTVVLLEDLHWIDKASEEFLQTLVERLAATRLLLVATHRPGYRAPWMDRSYATQITLRPLGAIDSIRVISSVVESDVLPSQVSSAIVKRADGNPFFLEELARALIEPGQADQDIPYTVQGVLMARIDRLPDTTKRLLQTAAVLGREVPVKLLSRIWEGDADIESELLELTRLEFLYQRQGGDEPTYVFKHALTQDVAYSSLLTARRQALHVAAAEALEALYADRVEDIEGALAYHYDRTTLSEKAVTYLIRLADKAARVYANTEAIAHLERAGVHLQRMPATRDRDRKLLEVALRQAHSLYFLGRFRESVDRLLEEESRLETVDDPAIGGAYHFWLAHMYSRLGDQSRASECAHRAIDQAALAGDDVVKGRAHGLLALEGHFSGKSDDGLGHGAEAVALLERNADYWWLGMAHFYIAMNYLVSGQFEAAIEAAARARQTGKLIDDPRLQSYAGFITCWVLASRGDVDAAIEEGRRSVEQSPDRVSRVYSSMFLGYAHLERGDAEPALALLEPALQQLSEFGFPQWHGLAASLVAEARHLAGRQEQSAAELARQGLEIVTSAKYWYGVGLAHRVLGRLAYDAGKLAAAEGLLQQALSTFDGIGSRFEAARTRLELARLELAREDAHAAAPYIARASETFAELAVPVYLARAESLAPQCGIASSGLA